jgi:hypothetical protein
VTAGYLSNRVDTTAEKWPAALGPWGRGQLSPDEDVTQGGDWRGGRNCS